MYLGAIDLIVHEFFTAEVAKQTVKMKVIKVISVLVGWLFIMAIVAFFDAHGGHDDEEH